jgi:hypothetical protein
MCPWRDLLRSEHPTHMCLPTCLLTMYERESGQGQGQCALMDGLLAIRFFKAVGYKGNKELDMSCHAHELLTTTLTIVM